MTLRFTDTDKWRDPWFRKLPPWGKLLWGYLCDNVDVAGVWQVDTELCDMLIGMPIPWGDVPAVMTDRVRELSTSKWLLTKFVRFQFRKGINPGDPFGKSVLICLERHGLSVSDVDSFLIQKQGAGEGLPRGYLAPQDKTGQDRTPTGKELVKDKNAELIAAIRGCGMPATTVTASEWAALAQGRAGCASREDVIAFLRWAVKRGKDDGVNVQYAKHAAVYADAWKARA